MTDEQREKAIEIMQDMPRSMRRSYREIHALVCMIEPLAADKPRSVDDTTITISRPMMQSMYTLACGLRDALAVSAQQARSIASLLDIEDAWDTPGGNHERDEACRQS